MTLATRITFLRILLIPVFVAMAVYYGQSVAEGSPLEWCRWAAVSVFLIASLSDALDGWIARRFNQRSTLGRILDPAADKGLLLAAIITLSLAPWSREHRFPLWFPILVVTRDVLSIGGVLLVKHVNGTVRIKAHWSGKVNTVAQMVALGWAMLQWTWVPLIVPVIVAGAFTFLSGMVYLADGLRQLREHGHGDPEG